SSSPRQRDRHDGAALRRWLDAQNAAYEGSAIVHDAYAQSLTVPARFRDSHTVILDTQPPNIFLSENRHLNGTRSAVTQGITDRFLRDPVQLQRDGVVRHINPFRTLELYFNA